MKERIPVQIRVRKMNGLGYSKLEPAGRVMREMRGDQLIAAPGRLTRNRRFVARTGQQTTLLVLR